MMNFAAEVRMISAMRYFEILLSDNKVPTFCFFWSKKNARCKTKDLFKKKMK